jgi:hypothetical protein
MSLSDFLKKQAEIQAQTKKDAEQKQAIRKEGLDKFKGIAKNIFDTIITPKLADLMRDLNANGCRSKMGQDVQAISYSAGLQKSVTFTYKNIPIQLDLVPNLATQKIDLNFTTKQAINVALTSVTFSSESFTWDQVEQAIEDYLAMVN